MEKMKSQSVKRPVRIINVSSAAYKYCARYCYIGLVVYWNNCRGSMDYLRIYKSFTV